MERSPKYLKQILILTGLSCLFFIAGNNILSLTNPDEVFYVQTAKEMIQHKTWMTPYLFGAPQFEKPILTYWLLRIAFSFLGISAFSARLFPAVFAVIGVMAVYFLGLLGFKDEKRAKLCALILLSAGLYIGLAKTVFTDLIFSVLILLSLLAFFWAYSRQEKRSPGILLFFAFAGFAVLTKGPLGILITSGTVLVFLLARKDIKFLLKADFFWGIVLFCLIAVPWYALMIKMYGSEFTNEFFYNDHFRRLIEAEHVSNDTWYFYPLSGIGSMFPWSIYVFFSFGYLLRRLRQDAAPIHIFLASWISVVFLIFEPAHSKLVSYIFPLFPALALMTGDFILDALDKKRQRLLFFISLATILSLVSMPIAMMVAIRQYSVYIGNTVPVFIFIAVFMVYLAVMLFLLFRRKTLIYLYILVFLIPMLLTFAFCLHKNFISYVSCKNGCQYLMENYEPKGRLLCSKFFVRSARFFTGRDVAAVDINGEGFFSPHPIPFLNTKEKVLDFLRTQPVTYCVLRKSCFEDVGRLARGRFKFELLKVVADEYLARVSRL